MDSGLRFFRNDDDARDVENLLHENWLVELYVEHQFKGIGGISVIKYAIELVNVDLPLAQVDRVAESYKLTFT